MLINKNEVKFNCQVECYGETKTILTRSNNFNLNYLNNSIRCKKNLGANTTRRKKEYLSKSNQT